MSATDELRRLLDERGAEYTFIPGDEYSREHIKIGSTEIWTNGRDEVAVYFLTPEQAVEATLGRGECRLMCKLIPTRDKPRSKAPTLTCSECGWWTDEIGKAWNYCPSCGRRVIG